MLGLRVRFPPGAWISVCCACCVLSGRRISVELITRPEESYRLWYIVLYVLETSWMRRPCSTGGGGGVPLLRPKQRNKAVHIGFPYDAYFIHEFHWYGIYSFGDSFQIFCKTVGKYFTALCVWPICLYVFTPVLLSFGKHDQTSVNGQHEYRHKQPFRDGEVRFKTINDYIHSH